MSTYLDTAARPSTLHEAFLKARTWLWEQPYYDTVEIKLFEWRLKRNMEELARRMKEGYRFDALTGYYIPKDLKSARKYAYRSFIDEVATVAAVLAVAPRMERAMDAGGAVSFGNRLVRAPGSDRFFLSWDRAWDAFSRACGRAARFSPWYLRTDVKNFYPEIPLRRLDATLDRVLPRDPIRGFFRAMNHQPCPLLKPGFGIPAGPVVSGFIANLYLLPLDMIIKGRWKAGARFRRYVDDMFFFAKTSSAARRAHRSLSALVSSRFRLRLHDELKSEIAYSHDPLGRGGSGERDHATWLFERVYGSLFRLDGKLLARFRREPERFLKWYARGLRWLGIHVSTDWLAQRILTVGARGSRSHWLPENRYRRLDIPDVELFGVEKYGMRTWAEDFARRNPGFMRDLAELHRLTKRLTREAYANLGDVRKQLKKEMKGRIFALRYYAARLAMMRCDRVEPIFRMLMDHPWILDPSLAINAFLSMPHAYEKISGYLDAGRPELIRAKAAWALGELGDRRAVRPLWDFAKHGRGAVARRSALESLLRIDDFRAIPVEWVIGEAFHEKDPAIRKFHYLILGRMRPGNLHELLDACAKKEHDVTAALALEFAAHESGSLYRIAGELRRVREPVSTVPQGHPAERR